MCENCRVLPVLQHEQHQQHERPQHDQHHQQDGVPLVTIIQSSLVLPNITHKQLGFQAPHRMCEERDGDHHPPGGPHQAGEGRLDHRHLPGVSRHHDQPCHDNFIFFKCMDNVHFDNLYNNTMPNAAATAVPQFVKSDPSLFKDEVDIRFSRTLNNCKVPQIRYATPERLLQRLTDLRFLSIDFLNTFLLTYKVFADGVQVSFSCFQSLMV